MACRAHPKFTLNATNEQAVVRICHLVNGIPLAIILAAAWIKLLSPSEIVRELGQGVDFLAVDLRDLPDRQRRIRAALTNLNLTEGSTAAGLIVLDFLLDVEMVDERIAHYQQRMQGFREVEREEVRLFAAGRNLLNLRLYDGSQYQGTYRHPGYGEFTITSTARSK